MYFQYIKFKAQQDLVSLGLKNPWTNFVGSNDKDSNENE